MFGRAFVREGFFPLWLLSGWSTSGYSVRIRVRLGSVRIKGFCPGGLMTLNLGALSTLQAVAYTTAMCTQMYVIMADIRKSASWT